MFIAEGCCLGFISAVTDAKGAVTRYEYTPTGKVSKATKADGSTEQYQYDKNGNLIRYIDAKGNATTYTYDSMDRLVAVKDALGGVKTIKYTACGQIAEFIDGNGNKTKYSYDELDRLVEVTDAKGARTNYAYDAVGNLTAVHQYVGVTKDTVNAMGLSIWQKSAYPTGLTEQVTRYEYDSRGLLVKEINPANKVTVYTYDANGNLVSKVDEEGYTTSFAYDPENNLKKITYHDGKQVEYQYDALNQVIGMKDWLGETTYELDALGRLLKVKDYQNQITEYTWSSTGEKQSIKYPDDSVVSYEYDALGRMTKVTDAQNKVTTYQYDELGNLVQKLLPNGVKTKYQYDALSRITRLSNYNKMGKLLDDYKYSYDAVGNKNKIERYNYDKGFLGLLGDETEGVTKYNYDQLNQLVEVIKPNKKVEKYFYDTIGNRVRTENWTFGILTDASDYKYDNLNQLKEINGSAFPAFCHGFTGQSLKMEYDQRGNLIKTTSGNKVIGQYTFDAANRLTEATNAFGVKTNFVYDGDGKRVKMEVIQPKQNIPGFPCIPGFTSGLLSDLLPNCNVNNNGYVTEKDFYNWLCNGKDNKVEYNYALDITEPYENVLLVYGKEIDTQRYTYGLDVISVDTWDKKADVFSWVWGCLKIRCPQKSERSYYLQDELGSPRRLIGETGSTKALYSYDAFGKPIEPINPFSHIATIDNIYSYTGYQYDLSTGLMYAQARYYMPETGRFISRDPYKGNVVDPQSLTLYVYCVNNPISYVDPSGYEAVLIGYVYVAEGIHKGELATYTGSTAQGIRKRFSNHDWKDFILDKNTTVTIYEVEAELNVSASGKGTLRSARNEALRTAEQEVLDEMKRRGKVLNKRDAATTDNAKRWSEIHKVKTGKTTVAMKGGVEVNTGSMRPSVKTGKPQVTLKGGVRAGASGVLTALDIFLFARDINMSQYIFAPHILRDEGGFFNLEKESGGLFGKSSYWKVYQEGQNAGQMCEIDESEFEFWRKEGEALWGTTDIWGNFVPGLLRPELLTYDPDLLA